MSGLPEKDAYGYAAFVCVADRTPLEPALPPGVLTCPTCSHRTDEPGDGVLGDAFDVAHRQWGLRGDVHVWQVVRDLVAARPTPADDEAVRAAFVEAFEAVTGMALDDANEMVVYRPQLDHGGMSGGSIDLAWWRTKGVPLLVDRAVDRRPSQPPTPSSTPPSTTPSFTPPPTTPTSTHGRVRSSPPDGNVKRVVLAVLVWGVVLAIPAALLGGGALLLYQRAVGTRVEATVLECDTSGTIIRGGSTYRTDCIAEWTIDDSTVIGAYTGGNGESAVGKTVDATVRGDTAHSRSLALPIILIALGLPFLAIPFLAIRSRRTNQQAPVS